MIAIAQHLCEVVAQSKPYCGKLKLEFVHRFTHYKNLIRIICLGENIKNNFV
jgi:hypothetical protein